MKDRTKEVFFPLFALFVIFSDELFYSIMSILDIPIESGMKSRVAIFIAVFTYCMMLVDVFKGKYNARNWRQYAALLIVLLLYGITAFNYPRGGYAFNNYVSSFLVYGALSIPATYVGMRLARGGYEKAILRYLPYYLLFVSVVVSYAIVTSSMQGIILGRGDEDFFNYQNASYFISYCCAYCIFYVFFDPNKNKNLWGKLMYIAITVLIFLCAVSCLIGGGRGAFVYLLLVSAFLVYRIVVQSAKKNNVKYFLMLFGAAAVIIFLAAHFNIFDTVGAQRVAGNLTTDSIRTALHYKALSSFLQAPVIGHGLGSVWWEVGYYSHNLLFDFLVEMGIIGACIMTAIIIPMFTKLFRSSKGSQFDMFILLIFLGHMVQAAFSGYWISSFLLFLIFGYVYGKNRVVGIKGAANSSLNR